MTDKNKLIRNKSFLVTGGTGSFGEYMVGELLKHGPKEVRIFSRDEDKQYSMQHDLKKFSNVRFIIGDVREFDSVLKATKGIDIVFHAAALKQIPSSEYNVIQAVRTNVLGAQNVVDACIANNVERAIAISTDKAVEPINVMGMTKGLQERIFILGNKYKGKERTRFACVRYGNVFASRGSVVPLFLKQIKAGGPLTVTSRKMTRFILTLDSATNLVFFGLSKMTSGEIFVPNIKAIKIIDLAEVLIEKFKPKNKKIIEIGVRPGEKIHETLISVSESLRTRKTNGYYVIHPNIDLDKIGYTYNLKLSDEDQSFVYTSDKADFYSKKEIINLLKAEGLL